MASYFWVKLWFFKVSFNLKLRKNSFLFHFYCITQWLFVTFPRLFWEKQLKLIAKLLYFIGIESIKKILLIILLLIDYREYSFYAYYLKLWNFKNKNFLDNSTINEFKSIHAKNIKVAELIKKSRNRFQIQWHN